MKAIAIILACLTLSLGAATIVIHGPTAVFSSTAAAGPFDPDSVATLRHWYKPGATVWKDSGGTPAADGDDLYSWRDSKGSGHMLVGGGGAAPKYRTTFGPSSGPCVDFNIATFQYLYFNDSSRSQPITVFCLVKIASQASDSGLWSSTTPANDGISLSASTTGTLDGGSSLALPAIVDTGWIIVSACLNGANSWVRTNGVQYATGSAGSSAMAQLLLGTDDSLSKPLLGKMVETLMYSGTLIATNNISHIEDDYLRATYGL